MRRTARLTIVGIALLCAACSSSGSNGHGSSVASSVSGTDTSSASTVPSSPSSSSTSTPTASGSTTSVPTSSQPPSSSTAPGPPGCATSQLNITVFNGGGASQVEYATIHFINKGQSVCALTGYPGVSLRLGAALLGAPATRSGKPYTSVTLAPGASANALLSDHSSCNASRSQVVRIYPPNQTQYVDLPLYLRGCPLTIDPVVAAG